MYLRYKKATESPLLACCAGLAYTQIKCIVVFKNRCTTGETCCASDMTEYEKQIIKNPYWGKGKM